ncbi:hypothetical protein J2847_005901, partial [Azospirillum agricola]|uniref:phage tail length tape measure family protein n=1 Tax=Azospirillum agricola TaxID=1720247 RepID=UPI001AE1073A
MAAESRLLDLTVSAEGVAAGVNQAKSFLASLVGDLGKASSAAIETNVKIRDAGAGVGRAFAGIAKELLPAADGLSRIARQVDAVTQAQERGAAGHRQAADMIGRLKDGLNVAQTGYVDLARAATQTEKAISSAYRSGKIGADEFKTSILATREAVYEQAAAVQRLADKERAQAQARIAQEREIKALAAERIAAEARAAAGQASVNRTLGVRHGPDLVGAARDDYAADVARLLAEQDQALSVASSKSQKLVNELLGVRYLAPLAAEVEADYAAFWGAIADKQDQAIVAAAGRSQKAVNELLGVRHFAPLAAEAEAEYAAFWSEVVGKQEQASVAAAGQSQKLVNELLGVRYLGSLGKQVERDYEATWERLLQEQEEATERAAQKAAEANAKLATSYKQVMASIDPAIAQQQKYDSALADLRAGAAAAGRSAEELAADEMRLAASMSPAALAAKKEADALEALKARADPASAALRRLAQDQAALDAAHAAGKLDPDEYTTYTAAIQRHRNIVEQSTASQKAMTNAVGLNKAQMQALAPQINDVVSGLIMGQPPMMIFTQQSGQIVQALQAGGAELPKFSLGMGVVAAGAVAVAAGLATAIYGAYRFTSDLREFERAVRLTGSATSITSHGLSEMAVQIAATQHISRAATREVATAYAATGKVGADVLGGLTAATKNWASATGQEVGDATKELAGLFVDPAKGADTLIDRYGLLDDSQRKLIRNYQAQGNLEQAQVVMLRAIEDRAEGAADRINKVAAAWERVKKWTSDKVDQVGERAVETISPSRDTEIRDLEASLAGSMWSGKRARKQARLDELRGEERDDAIKKWELGVRTEYNRLSAAAGDFARSVDPAIAASTNFANAEGLINRALDVGAVKKEEAARLLGLYRKQLLDSIDPAKAFADEMERQARVMEAAAGRARDFEIQRQQILQKPGRLSSDSLTPDETAKINAGLDRKYAAEAADRHRTAQEAIQDAKALGAATASLSQPALVAAQAQAVFFDVLRKTSDYKKAKQAEDDAYTKGMVEWSAQVDASVKTSVLAVDAARRLAEAQAQGGVIATAQAQAQNVHAEQVARGVDPVRALALANADYQKSLASLAGQQAAWNRDIGEQIEGAQRLARAEAVSGAAVAEANIQNKVRAQVLKEGVSAESARAQAIEAGTRALEAQNAVARVNASIRQGNQDLDLARAEFELLGRSNAERERTIAILKATLEVQNSGDWAQVPQETRDAWVAQAGAVAEYQARIADATETSRDFANVITQGFEDALVSGGKLGDLLKGLEADIKRIVVRGVITKPLETYLTGNLTKLLAGTPPGDSQVKPVTASDPGGYKALFDKLSGGAGALGSQSNPMWIRMSAGAPALDVSQFSGGAALPVAVQDGGAIVDAIRSEARAQGVPEEVALAIGRIESGLQQYRADGSVLRSSAGAMGVMQLMPGTAQWLGVDASDTRDNIRGGVKFLAQLGRQFGGDWSQVAGAYNAGPGRMTQYLQQGRALPAEAVTYIEKFGSSVQTANAAVVGLAAPVQSMAMAQTAQVRAQQAGATATQALSEGQQDAVSAALAAVRGMDAVRGTAEDVDARWSAVSDSSTTAVQKMADAQRRAADTMAGGAAVFASGAQQAGA